MQLESNIIYQFNFDCQTTVYKGDNNESEIQCLNLRKENMNKEIQNEIPIEIGREIPTRKSGIEIRKTKIRKYLLAWKWNSNRFTIVVAGRPIGNLKTGTNITIINFDKTTLFNQHRQIIYTISSPSSYNSAFCPKFKKPHTRVEIH